MYVDFRIDLRSSNLLDGNGGTAAFGLLHLEGWWKGRASPGSVSDVQKDLVTGAIVFDDVHTRHTVKPHHFFDFG